MLVKRIFALIFIGALSISKGVIKAQTNKELPSISIGVGYYGDQITHPGLLIFGEVGLNKQNWLLGRVNVTGYRHKGHSRNILILPELLVRTYTENTNYWEASLGSGLLYQRSDSPIYELEEDEFVQKNTGYVYFNPSFGIRYGNTIQLKDQRVLTPSLGARISYQYPFNNFWLLNAALDLSIAYKFK